MRNADKPDQALANLKDLFSDGSNDEIDDLTTA